jgi:hypothetical protein
MVETKRKWFWELEFLELREQQVEIGNKLAVRQLVEQSYSAGKVFDS